MSTTNDYWSQFEVVKPAKATAAEVEATPSDYWSQFEVVEPTRAQTSESKIEAGIRQSLRATPRIVGKGVSSVLAGPSKGIGGVLDLLSKGFAAGEQPGFEGSISEPIKKAADWFQQTGEGGEEYLNSQFKRLLGDAEGPTEESLTGAVQRFGNLLPMFAANPAKAMAGAIMGEVGNRAGLPEYVNSFLELITAGSTDKLKSFFSNIKKSPLTIAQQLEKDPKAVGKLMGLEGTQLEAFNALEMAEQESLVNTMLEYEQQIREGASKSDVLGRQVRSQVSQAEQVAPLAGRVAQGGEPLGLEVPTARTTPTSTETNLNTVLNAISPQRIGNARVAGQALKDQIMQLDNAAYQGVNTLYDRARELNAPIESTHQQLVSQLTDRLERLEEIPSPSYVQQNLIRSLRDILNDLATVEDGAITGYLPISNATLIDQIQSLRQKIDFEFTHGNAKNIFRPVIREIQDSVYRAAPGEAGEALRQANSAYREWSRTFDTDYINPYRDPANQDFEKLLKKNFDPDHLNVVRQVAGATPVGRQVFGSVEREIVEETLKKFVDKPELIRTPEYRKAIDALSSKLSPQQLEAVQSRMQSLVPERLMRRAEQAKTIRKDLESLERSLKAAQKYSGRGVSEVRKLTGTPEGIQQLKKDLSRTANGEQIFKKLAKEKIRSILREGKIYKTPTGKQLFNVLNDEKNFALIESMTSPKEASEALEAAKALQGKEVTAENVKKILGKASKTSYLSWLLW